MSTTYVVEVRPRRAGEPSFDFDVLDGYVKLVQQHNAGWTDWFERGCMPPDCLAFQHIDTCVPSNPR